MENISLYATGRVALRHPFVKSELRKPDYNQARETVSVEIINPSTSNRVISCKVKGEIVGENITFEKTFRLMRGEEKQQPSPPKNSRNWLLTLQNCGGQSIKDHKTYMT